MAKIMVVDDEPNICEAVKFVLEDEGFEVITAFNAEECINKLKKEPVDLVLIDFFMPKISGRKLCEKIRKDPELENLKLAFLTVARFSELGLGELEKLKVLDYIQKPFDNEDLVKRVKKMLNLK